MKSYYVDLKNDCLVFNRDLSDIPKQSYSLGVYSNDINEVIENLYDQCLKRMRRVEINDVILRIIERDYPEFII